MQKTSRRTFLEAVSAAAVFSRFGSTGEAASADPNPNTLWYRQPAGKWEEALPVGNGRLGARIFGGVENERLQLNEITVWSGKLEPDADSTSPENRFRTDDGQTGWACEGGAAERQIIWDLFNHFLILNHRWKSVWTSGVIK